MIVRMKKVTVITQAKDALSAVSRLRSLGVVHVEDRQPPRGKDISSLQEDIALLESTLGILEKPEFKNAVGFKKGKYIVDWKLAANRIMELQKRLDHLQEYSRRLNLKIKEWEAWGDFDPDAVRSLAEKNVYMKFYKIPKGELGKIPPDVIVKTVFYTNGFAGCVVISKNNVIIPFNEIILPESGLSQIRSRAAEDTQIIQSIKAEILKHTSWRGGFIRIKKAFVKELEFHEVLRGMGQDGRLSYLTGYIPHNAAAVIRDTAGNEKWGLIVDDPSEDDNIPTLIRNPRWISIISPVFKLIETVPGYRELDISLFFLIFLSIFFGILIGDAGYGLIFTILTFIAHMKFRNRIKDVSVFVLFYLLSSCAIIWGVLSGTFFGQQWFGQSLKPLLPALRNDQSVQAFCFFVGAVHLSIGHLWRVIVKLPSLAALADAGWVSILWGGFFLAKTLILGHAFPVFGKLLFLGGIPLVILFTKPSKNLLKGMSFGLGSLLLNIVNSFTDIVSYIRLFAVGLATVAIADAFNNMAMDVGYNGFAASLLTSAILLLGHGLNIVLGPMSVIVHGVRLNVLEFCNHADIKWSGFSYRPLKE